jgi:type 1 glutamine amidotransferase
VTSALRFTGTARLRGTVARLVLAAAIMVGLLPTATPAASAAEVPHILVFSATFGFRHTSIKHGNEVIQQLADQTKAFTVEFSELPTDLNATKLAGVDILLFNNNTGRLPLTDQQRTDLVRYWGCGGGWIGLHSATDSNKSWDEWAEVAGAQFDSHPHVPDNGNARLLVENADHPVNAAFADKTEWMHTDEYYRWRRDVRGHQDVVPLLALDETSVRPGIQTSAKAYTHRQPLVWVKTFRDRGRVYYNNLGHRDQTFDRPEFRKQLVDGISWVSEVRLDSACFTGDQPLPPPASAPTPDPEAERAPCKLGAGEKALTPNGYSEKTLHPLRPAHLDWNTRTLVVDLSSTGAATSDVVVNLAWPVRADDYDLMITSPWGWHGSDGVQPVADGVETVRIADVPHCTPLLVDVYNWTAVSGQPPTVTATLAPAQ